MLQNGVLYVRKADNLLVIDCESGSDDGKYKGKLIHHYTDLNQSHGFTYDPDRKAIVNLRSYEERFTVLSWSSFQFQRGKKFVKRESDEEDKEDEQK